jgi:hypothetical protein
MMSKIFKPIFMTMEFIMKSVTKDFEDFCGLLVKYLFKPYKVVQHSIGPLGHLGPLSPLCHLGCICPLGSLGHLGPLSLLGKLGPICPLGSLGHLGPLVL